MVAAGMWEKVCLFCSKTGALLADLSNINQIFWSVVFSPCNQGKVAVPVLAAGCTGLQIECKTRQVDWPQGLCKLYCLHRQ